MIRLAVKFAYMGDGFCGSQIQPGCRTVEGEMLSALGKVSGDCDPCLRIASRTDKGVNALGNVAAVSTELEPHTLLRALNAVSDGVFYRSFAVVDDSFNPRLASDREYRYILPSEGLDADLARECAAAFTGEHDFAGFCRPDGKPTVVTVDSIDVSEEGDLLVAVDVSARFGADSVRRANASLNYYKVLIASSQIMQQRITQLMCRLYKPDIMVGLPADSYGMFEFYRSEEILEAGRAATRAALERLETDGENGMVFAESEEKIATARF